MHLSVNEDLDSDDLDAYYEVEEDYDPSPWCNCGTCSPEDGFPPCVRTD